MNFGDPRFVYKNEGINIADPALLQTVLKKERFRGFDYPLFLGI